MDTVGNFYNKEVFFRCFYYPRRQLYYLRSNASNIYMSFGERNCVVFLGPFFYYIFILFTLVVRASCLMIIYGIYIFSSELYSPQFNISWLVGVICIGLLTWVYLVGSFFPICVCGFFFLLHLYFVYSNDNWIVWLVAFFYALQ